jgi:hypothetical protein
MIMKMKIMGKMHAAQYKKISMLSVARKKGGLKIETWPGAFV